MLQRPGEAYAIWHFWFGDERAFRGWYVNFQEPFRRTPQGYDTQDLELDIWAPLDGPWEWKDDDVLEERVVGGPVHRRADRSGPGRRAPRRRAARRGRALVGRRVGVWLPDDGWDVT